MKELCLTTKQHGELIRAFDIANPRPDRVILTDHIREWIEQCYHCKVFSDGQTLGLTFYEDKDLTFFLLKHPC